MYNMRDNILSKRNIDIVTDEALLYSKHAKHTEKFFGRTCHE